MTIAEAEIITADFGNFYAEKRDSLQVLADGTTADNYEDIPYFSVWDLPHSPAKIKYAILFRAEHAVKHDYMEFIPPGDEREESHDWSKPPIGNILHNGYGLLGDFVENAYVINKERLDIWAIQDDIKQKVAIVKFEAKYKINFVLPDQFELRAEFRQFLADLYNNWQK